MSSRRHGREAALQIIYLFDSGMTNVDTIPAAAWSAEPLTPKIKEFSRRLAWGVIGNQPSLDALIVKYAANWEMKRMAAIDRSVLRLAAYEILHETETPINVIINEALEIVKTYSTSESSKFVNGILDKIKEERPHGKSGS